MRLSKNYIKSADRGRVGNIGSVFNGNIFSAGRGWIPPGDGVRGEQGDDVPGIDMTAQDQIRGQAHAKGSGIHAAQTTQAAQAAQMAPRLTQTIGIRPRQNRN